MLTNTAVHPTFFAGASAADSSQPQPHPCTTQRPAAVPASAAVGGGAPQHETAAAEWHVCAGVIRRPPAAAAL